MDPDLTPQSSATGLEEFFNLSIDLLCIVGFDGYFKRVNPALVETLGYPRAELFSRTVFDITHPDDVEPARQALAGLGEGRDLVGFTARVISADGSVHWLEWNTRTAPEQGVVYGVARNATERRRAEAGLRETQRKLEASRDELSVIAREQAALRRVATLVTQGPPPGAVFEAVTSEVADLFDASAVQLARHHEDEGRLHVVAEAGLSARAAGADSLRLDGTSVASTVVRTGHPARRDDFGPTAAPDGEVRRGREGRSVVATPVVVDRRIWGVLVATWVDAGPPPEDTEARLASFAELLATGIANADAHDQLTASRARVLAAGDDARRRVVRDLHDGAQQRLVRTIVNLKLAERELSEEGKEAGRLLGDALDAAEEAMTELRELAHGILPSVLVRGGLPTGLESLVSRLDLPVDLDVTAERLPPDIEASAYFILAEALTNVVKHANATCADVKAVVEEGQLTLTVRDDGLGGADPEGPGLVGIADRADALGGRLQVDSGTAGGTELTARLPLMGDWADAESAG